MSSVKLFIINNIKSHLMLNGLGQYNAAYCAEIGYKHYEKTVGNSKNPFNDACDYAGAIAEQRCIKFKYVSPKSKSAKRTKKPQEAFDFESSQKG